MTIRDYVSQRRWSPMGPVLPGGTVYALALSPNKDQHNPLLAGTPVGVFRSLSHGDNWSWANRGLVGLQIAALASSSNGVLFLGSLDGSLARSVDGGYSWLPLPRLDDSGSVTALAVSPDYLNDGALLIGTESGGVFRSTDSGKTAKAANFGLSDPGVLCLACAPGWPRKPVAFAGTESGLFRSTNGGRAWREAQGDLQGLAVQAVAASPRFERDGTAFAATEEDGLFRSRDAGANWESIGADIPDSTVNCLWISPQFGQDHTLLAGTSTKGVYLSTDGGEVWQPVVDTGSAVLALGGDEQAVFAGFHNNGVYRSDDRGQSWEPRQEGMHAHALTFLVATPGATLFAAGPDTGVYQHSGDAWEALAELPQVTGVAAFAVAPSFPRRSLLAISDVEKGLYVSPDGGHNWRQASSEQVTAVCVGQNGEGGLLLFAGTADGRLLQSKDEGASWEESAPFQRQLVVRLDASPAFAHDCVLVAGTRDPGDPSAPVSVWRSTDSGRTWQRVLQEEVALPHLSFAFDTERGSRLLIAMDRFVVREGEKGWQRSPVASSNPPVLTVAVRHVGGERVYFAGTTLGIFASTDGANWRPISRGMGYAPILAFAPGTGDDSVDIWALGLGGLVWRWERGETEAQ